MTSSHLTHKSHSLLLLHIKPLVHHPAFAHTPVTATTAVTHLIHVIHLVAWILIRTRSISVPLATCASSRPAIVAATGAFVVFVVVVAPFVDGFFCLSSTNVYLEVAPSRERRK